MRFALGVEYDGRPYLGWQAQAQSPTVQETLEAGLSEVADHPVRVFCAGRTDTGVHARCQVVHFDSEAERNERQWVLGANANLPGTIAVLWARPVDGSFHARFSAHSREYRYDILNRWVRPAMEAGSITWWRRPLDHEAMHEAAQVLLGEHDFSAFRSSGCQATHAVRTVRHCTVNRAGNRVWLEIRANGFLYHMVRNITGSLLEVGSGDRPPAWLGEVLGDGEREAAGVTAPAAGLAFVAAHYPESFGLPGKPTDFPSGWNRT